jgi:hypothetical protein
MGTDRLRQFRDAAVAGINATANPVHNHIDRKRSPEKAKNSGIESTN